MTYPNHDYDGLDQPSSSPFDWFLEDLGGSTPEDDVDETIEDDELFNDRDLLWWESTRFRATILWMTRLLRFKSIL